MIRSRLLCALGRIIVALLVVYMAAAVLSDSPFLESPAMAQSQGNVPGNVLGNDSDSEFWRQIRRGVSGTVSIPDKTAGVLVHPGGEGWRAIRNGPIATYSAWALAAIIVVIAVFYSIRGRLRVEEGMSGRLVQRFSDVEVFTHWLTASSFVVLALTGLNILYGKYVLAPIIGQEAFATITGWGKYAHNYISFAFMLGVVLMIVLWARDNLPDRYDAKWLLHGGGFFTKHDHPPSNKFNAGQKMIFWAIVLGGGLNTFTGLSLLFPFYWMDLQGMQWMHILHAISAVILMLVVIPHIYIATLGMEGAWHAMHTGSVDANWLRQHHSVWYAKREGGSDPSASSEKQPVE